MKPDQLRVAMFSGNYNYVRDGANQALNRLVEFLLRQGVAVRVYSPTTNTPAFEPQGDLVSVPSLAFPGNRGEYRFSLGLMKHGKADLAAFQPNIIHVAAPDVLGHRAITWARSRGIAILGSVHTRFETYLQYYRLGWLEWAMKAMLRRFYRRCDALVAPSESMADVMRAERMNFDIGIWARGIDTGIFHPGRRCDNWRQALGIAQGEVAIGFLGRLVMEKGLDVFCNSIDQLKAAGVPHRVLVVGEGPAKEWFAGRLPEAVFAGFQKGDDLGRAVASMDLLFNPSITETFGNVTLEAMACAIPVVAARATGSENLVSDGVTGRLVKPGDATAFAEVLAAYCTDDALRAKHGAAGLAASAAYDWDHINQAVLDTYLRIVRNG
jgi:phosphatidylinositol alpha 1,6-mannosyltransferase